MSKDRKGAGAMAKTSHKGRRLKWKRMRPLYIMMIPGTLYLIINNYFPMFGIFIAFKKIDYSKGIFASQWTGFDNFRFLFATKDAFVITRNTILYNLVFIVLGTIAGVTVAILLNEVISSVWKKLYQTILLLPQLISIVIVAYIGYAFLNVENGFLNNSVLPLLGLEPVSWYSEPRYWPFILTITHLWKGLGYGSVVYFSAILGIDRELYEAASIDGAKRGQQIRLITLPLLKTTIIIMVLMSVGNIFRSDFGLFYQLPLNSGALYSTTNTIDTYVFRALMQLNNTAMSSAAGVFQSVVGFIVIVIVNGIVRRVDEDSALY